MPELPEVEHVGRRLDRWMRGARIVAVSGRDPRIVRPVGARAFERAVRDRVVERIERRGKWLRIGLDDGARLFAHLGMTGWFEAATPGAPPLRFERVQFDLEREAARSLGAPPP